MRTLCDHIFDLAQNSINAGAQNIEVVIEEDVPKNLYRIVIKDDGRGIKPEHLPKAKDTFFTTRPHKNRRVGLGLALMDATCRRSGGELVIDSKYRYGTAITATMEHAHTDRPPLGDLPELYTSLMMSSVENNVIWTLEHILNGKRYRLKNRATRDELNIFSYAEPGVRDMLYQLIVKKEEALRG